MAGLIYIFVRKRLRCTLVIIVIMSECLYFMLWSVFAYSVVLDHVHCQCVNETVCDAVLE